MYYKGKIWLPIIEEINEADIGGNLIGRANFNDPYIIALLKGEAYYINPPLHYRYDTIVLDSEQEFPSPPSWQNFLGTDDQGRDVFARIIYGLRAFALRPSAATMAAKLTC
jgi:microcin C transport system permease protein